MTATKLGANDGITVHEYFEGVSYDVGDDLGHAFVSGGWAKAIDAAPENKDAGPRRRGRKHA